MADKSTPSHTETAFTADTTDDCTSNPNHEAKDNDSHDSTQQTFRFMDLPPELGDIIYTFAFNPDTKKTQDGGILDEPQLTAGLSNSKTARALSQVCRTVRQESMRSYYSKTTFVVRELSDRSAVYVGRILRGDHSGAPVSAPLDVWARTWGELGAQHIRSLVIRPLGGSVRIPMADNANPVSFEGVTDFNLSTSELKAAGSKAFSTSFKTMTAARRFEELLVEVGDAWHGARRSEVISKFLGRRF
jgi:hypothetical protein